jgi:hypothetical protein
VWDPCAGVCEFMSIWGVLGYPEIETNWLDSSLNSAGTVTRRVHSCSEDEDESAVICKMQTDSISQPSLPEGVLTVSNMEYLPVVRPSGSPSICESVPLPAPPRPPTPPCPATPAHAALSRPNARLGSHGAHVTIGIHGQFM